MLVVSRGGGTIDLAKDLGSSVISSVASVFEPLEVTRVLNIFKPIITLANSSAYQATGGQYFNSRTNWYGDTKDTLEIYEYLGNDKLENIVIPSSVDGLDTITIAPETFTGNDSIKFVVFPNITEYIGYMSFLNCTSLEKVILGNNTKSIGENAFDNTSIEKCF